MWQIGEIAYEETGILIRKVKHEKETQLLLIIIIIMSCR